MRASLDLADRRDRAREAVDEIARQHLAVVERKLADLAALRRVLTALLRQCQHGTVVECRSIETLAPTRQASP